MPAVSHTRSAVSRHSPVTTRDEFSSPLAIQKPHAAWLWMALVVAAALFAHGRGLTCGYIWDDDAYVEENMTLRSVYGLWRIWSDPTATPQYYPLVHTTFWIEYHLWGLWPAGFHATNILLHSITSILIGRLLSRMQVPGAWWIAMLFAVHPLHVESVAWVTERKNVLSGLFYLLAATPLLEALRVLPPTNSTSTSLPDEIDSRTLWKKLILAFILFLAALLSKTVTCTLPAAALLIAWGLSGSLTWRDVRITAPFFALGISMGLLTAYLEVTHVGATAEYVPLDRWDRLVLAGRIPWFYAYQIVWPRELLFIYPKWEIDAADPRQWLYPAATLSVLLGTFFYRTRLGRGPFVAVSYFLGTLFPALGFFNVYPMRFSYVADHFAYLASLGVIALAGAALTMAARQLSKRWEIPSAVSFSAAAVVVISLALVSREQTSLYKDVWTLWTFTSAKNPGATVARANLGQLLLKQGDVSAALVHIEDVYRHDPILDSNLLNWMSAKLQVQRYDEVMAKAVEFGQRLDDQAEYHRLIARAKVGTGDLTGAAEHFSRACQRFPQDSSLLGDHGAFLMQQNDLTTAESLLREATCLNENNGQAWSDLGICLARTGKSAEARAAFEKAVRKSPRLPDGWRNLSQWYLEQGRPDQSLATLQSGHLALPQDFSIGEELAWQLATSPSENVRNPQLAAQIVHQLLVAPNATFELNQRGLPTILRLTQIHLEAGDVPAARRLLESYRNQLPANDAQRPQLDELLKQLGN